MYSEFNNQTVLAGFQAFTNALVDVATNHSVKPVSFDGTIDTSYIVYDTGRSVSEQEIELKSRYDHKNMFFTCTIRLIDDKFVIKHIALSYKIPNHFNSIYLHHSSPNNLPYVYMIDADTYRLDRWFTDAFENEKEAIVKSIQKICKDI